LLDFFALLTEAPFVAGLAGRAQHGDGVDHGDVSMVRRSTNRKNGPNGGYLTPFVGEQPIEGTYRHYHTLLLPPNDG
jgi:hypothetical protein